MQISNQPLDASMYGSAVAQVSKVYLYSALHKSHKVLYEYMSNWVN